MTIKDKFQLVHSSIIQELDSKFVNYLDQVVYKKFVDVYSQPYEDLFLPITGFKVRINNVLYNSDSVEFQNLALKKEEREYKVDYNSLNNYCFGRFCNYFDTIILPSNTGEVRGILNDFEYFLLLQLSSEIQEYRISYGLYWVAMFLRIKEVLKEGSDHFYNRFNNDHINEINNELTRIEKKIEEHLEINFTSI